MSRTANFSRTLCDTLNGSGTAYKWRIGTPPYPCDNKECVDVIGENRDRIVLIEVELRRTAPVTNIVKIWKWLAEKNLYLGKYVLVVQTFSAYYDGQPSFQRDNAIFLGEEMQLILGESRVRYLPVNFPYSPYKKRVTSSVTEGGGAMRRAARELATTLASAVDRPRILTAAT
ncbi:MAG: hypothetical protein ROO76_23040 [Terriglobia bacterium]|nr:hypothetical protein [Terriglobia bacterium]